MLRNNFIKPLKFCSKKIFAFTLAEVLIVIGIIGVVSALTIPNLNSSTSEKEKIVKVQKIHSNLNEALNRAEAEYGPFKEWFKSDTTAVAQSTRFGERMSDFLKLQKNCGKNRSACLSNSSYKSLGGDDLQVFTGSSNYYYSVILADGAVVVFSVEPSGRVDQTGIEQGLIYVDIDGNKGANTYGKDFFFFAALGNQNNELNSVYGYTGEEYLEDCFNSGLFCSGWVLETGNMDYLKADRNGKCPNGKVLNLTTNTSCN